MSRPAFYELEQFDFWDIDSLLFISDNADGNADEHAPDAPGRSNGLDRAAGSAVAKAEFGLDIAATAPVDTNLPGLPDTGPFLSFSIGGTSLIDLPILYAKPDGAGGGGPGGGGGGGKPPKDDPGGDPTVLSEYTSGGNAKKSYNIDISFNGDGWTVDLQQYLINVADYLSTIITADLIDVIAVGGGGKVDDLHIDASLYADAESSVLGWAGPFSIRNPTFNHIPYSASVEFNLAYQDEMSSAQWQALVFQEMVHTLGFGVTWELEGLVDGKASDDPRFNGDNANDAYLYDPALEFAWAETNGTDPAPESGVPIENGGGTGTAGGHWEESIFDNEVMTGYIDINDLNGTNFLSIVTVAALEDMGYDTIYELGVTTTADLADDLMKNGLEELVYIA